MSIAEQHFGGNKAPLAELLPKEFAELKAEVDQAVAALKARPARVKTEEDFAKVGELVVAASKLASRLEDTRKGETDPLFQAQKTIKGWFDGLAATVSMAIKPHQDAATGYVKAKREAERLKAAEEAQRLRDQEEAARKKAEEAAGKTALRQEAKADQLAEQAAAAEAKMNVNAADAVRTTMAGGGSASARTTWAFEIVDYDAIPLDQLRPYLRLEHVESAIRSLVNVQKDRTKLPGVRVFEDVKATFRR